MGIPDANGLIGIRINRIGEPYTGTVPIELPPGSRTSSHNHTTANEGPSYGEGYLSSKSHGIGAFGQIMNDASSYGQARRLMGAAARRDFWIGLAGKDRIWVWPPNSNLSRQGDNAGPVFCGGRR